MRTTYRVRFSSKQQLLRVPVAWLAQSVDGIDESDTACSLVYHDPRLAFQVALIAEGTVVPEKISSGPSRKVGELCTLAN